MNHIILAALLGMVLFGLGDLFVKIAINKGVNANILMFYSLLIAAIPFGIWWFAQSVRLKIDFSLLGYSLILAILMFMATLFLIAAIKKGDASIVVPIGRMGFVITAICAFIFLGEKPTLTKGLGILFAILAIILLSRNN